MKGQVGGNEKRWIIINCLSGLSTRIMVSFIQQIEITADDIKIHASGEWTVVRRYNNDMIEARLRETEKSWKDIHFMNDHYFGEGTEARQVKEDQENERRYLEGLGDIHEAGVNWEKVCNKALSREISWLRDDDFDALQKWLESLSDKFALNVEGRNHELPSQANHH